MAFRNGSCSKRVGPPRDRLSARWPSATGAFIVLAGAGFPCLISPLPAALDLPFCVYGMGGRFSPHGQEENTSGQNQTDSNDGFGHHGSTGARRFLVAEVAPGRLQENRRAARLWRRGESDTGIGTDSSAVGIRAKRMQRQARRAPQSFEDEVSRLSGSSLRLPPSPARPHQLSGSLRRFPGRSEFVGRGTCAFSLASSALPFEQRRFDSTGPCPLPFFNCLLSLAASC